MNLSGWPTVLLALLYSVSRLLLGDLILPEIFRQQLLAELASLWGPLTRQAQ